MCAGFVTEGGNFVAAGAEAAHPVSPTCVGSRLT